MRRVPLGLLAVLLAAACNHRPTPPSPIPSTEPGAPARAVASSLYVCPGGYGWTAYGGVVFAPNDTTKPTAEVRPDRCFISLDQAKGAGFHLHPPPPGGALVETIYLVPPDPPILPVCLEAARQLGFTVLCPDLVPGDANSMANCDTNCISLEALVLAFSFSGPPGYVGIPGQSGNHLFVLESRVGRDRQVEFLTCFEGRTVAEVSVHGVAGRWVSCPANGSGLNSGHVMLVWVEHGVRYAVTLHGDTDLNRKIALTMVEHLIPVNG
jgi:hypothetical protein